MAVYSFSLESLNVTACRSKDGQDDVWQIATVNLGARGTVAVWPLGTGVQPGQGFTGPWTAGPYQAANGERCLVAFTFVNLSGHSSQASETIASDLADVLSAAVSTPAVGPGRVADEAFYEGQIRQTFGEAGEALDLPGLTSGQVDCRGLLGVHVALLADITVPASGELATLGPVTLSSPAPATCGPGPQSTAMFARRALAGRRRFPRGRLRACAWARARCC